MRGRKIARLDPSIGTDADYTAPCSLAELVNAKGRESTVGVGDLHVHVDRIATRAGISHRAEPQGVCDLEQLLLELRDLGLGVPVAHRPQDGCLFGDGERLILRPADTYADQIIQGPLG